MTRPLSGRGRVTGLDQARNLLALNETCTRSAWRADGIARARVPPSYRRPLPSLPVVEIDRDLLRRPDLGGVLRPLELRHPEGPCAEVEFRQPDRPAPDELVNITQRTSVRLPVSCGITFSPSAPITRPFANQLLPSWS